MTLSLLANILTQAIAVSREQPIVITKYIEQARNMEMDAIAKGGEMIFLFTSRVLSRRESIARLRRCQGPAVQLQPCADPVLGEEMASSSEVACFGHDKYEVYLKALISTTSIAPKRNVLFSIGSYRAKRYLLAMQKLSAAGHHIFATSGTADLLTEHTVPCKYLEALEDGNRDQQKSEYSLTQHLANNLINTDLSSKNHFRRFASYASKGHRSCRMAVDFTIPLVASVKKGKMLAEAEASKPRPDVSTVKSKSSHLTRTFPGFVTNAAFVSGVAQFGSCDLAKLSQATMFAGFSTSIMLPIEVGNAICASLRRTTSRPLVHQGWRVGFSPLYLDLCAG